MKKSVISTFASMFLLIGCTTSPVSSDKAKSVSADRILGFNTYYPSAAKLIITRDSGFLAGGGCYMAILIDSKTAARIDTSEIVTLYVDPGRHIIGIAGDKLGGGLCNSSLGKPIKESSTVIESGETQKFRISGDTTSGLDIRPTTL